MLVHADPRVYPPKSAPASDGVGLGQRNHPGRPAKSCDNPMVGKGVISQELLEIQLVAFLLAQGNQTYFAVSEGWTDVQQPRIDKQRPLEQWAWQPRYDVKYGAPLGPAAATNLTTAMGGGHSDDQLYTREFEHCTVSLAINAPLGNSSNASIVMKLKTA